MIRSRTCALHPKNPKPQVDSTFSKASSLIQSAITCASSVDVLGIHSLRWNTRRQILLPQNEVCVTGNIGGAVCANICKYQVGAVWAQANEKLSTKTWWWHTAISRIYFNVAKSSSEFELRNYNLQRKVTLRIVRRAGSIVNKPHQKLRSSQLVYQNMMLSSCEVCFLQTK